MEDNQKSSSKSFFPICNECGNILQIKIDSLNFSISYQCEANKNHKKNNIFFKTFERFYLKEKENLKCSKCFKPENNELFKCNVCNIIYCSKCLSDDNRKNKHLDFECYNTGIKCEKHNVSFNEYCFDCKKNLCMYCIKDIFENHEKHKRESYLNIIPFSQDIKDLSNKIEEKSKSTMNLIEKIENWKKELLNKIEQLIQNLKDELSFLKSFIYNFDNMYLNYSYLDNFKYIHNNIKNINNEYLQKFDNSYNFEDQTLYMNSAFKNLGLKNKVNTYKEISKKEDIEFHSIFTIIEKFNDTCVLANYNGLIQIIYYDQKTNELRGRINLRLKEKIYSLIPSYINNQIFICLLYQKKIKILEYNLEKKSLTLKPDEITDPNSQGNKHFNKCIQLIGGYFLTSDSHGITIWFKEIKNNSYFKLKEIALGKSTFDLLPIDNDTFIASQPDNKTLTFYDTNNFNELKKISKIDCVNSIHCISKVKNKFLMINCIKGIGLVFIKTKELISYFEDSFTSPKKYISCDDNGNIYLLGESGKCALDKKTFLLKLQINLENGEIVEKIKINNIIIDNKTKVTCLNNGNVFVWGDKLSVWDKII